MSNESRFNLDDDVPEDVREETPDGQDDDYASAERYEQDKLRLVDFLQYPKEKRKLTDFMEETYKAYEQESVDRTINRVVHEHDVELRGSTPYHKPGHIGPLMYEYLNMVGVESAFVSGLQHTKSSMTKTVQQRVDEINTLLRGVGGFNRQIKASFSRSAVVYLEQEDPKFKHREKVIFTINLADYELRYPMSEDAENQVIQDGRTLRRFVWDEAVNTLAEIVSNTGMKPKYVKNDKNSAIFTMRQTLLSPNERDPDEFFTFDLRYVNEEMRQNMEADYVSIVSRFNGQMRELQEKMDSIWTGAKAKVKIAEKIQQLEKERDFYIGTNPDPREMDYGLVFSISVNTLKDYSVTKDKMQVIMTKYILALSKIAVDKSMDQQVNNIYSRQSKANDFQALDAESHVQEHEEQAPAVPRGKKVVMLKEDVQPRKKATGGGRFRA